MSRAARLLDLMQVLRRRRAPASGRDLAAELGVSLRTLYRDIETLRGRGATIEGEAGLGYVLAEGFMLPPLMFDADEIDALTLGLRFVARQGDEGLAAAAHDALAKIAAALPAGRVEALHAAPLLAIPRAADDALSRLPALRAAMAAERKVALTYRDAAGVDTKRVVWPVAIGFFEEARVLAGWCERRAAFRHFRLDRILSLTTLDERPPRRRAVLMREWRKQAMAPTMRLLTESDAAAG